MSYGVVMFIGMNFGPPGGIAPAPADLCNVLFTIQDGGNTVAGATVTAKLEGVTSVVDDAIIGSTVNTATTDSGGQAILTLIQVGQFLRGGVYLIEATDASNKVLYKRRVTIPNQSTAEAQLLPDAI